MGVTLMENFEVSGQVGGQVALAEKGWVFPASNTVSIANETENGVTRKKLSVVKGLSAGVFDAIKIPIPASKAFYFSTRVRWSIANSPAPLQLRVGTVGTYAGITTTGNVFGFAALKGNGWSFYVGNVDTNPGKTFGMQEWITLEVLRKSDGSMRVWVNDILLYMAGATINAPADNYVYIGRLQVAGTSGTQTTCGWEFMDTVVVDPATAGLQNRPGSASRVLSVPFTSDLVTQWTLSGGATGAHYPYMATYPDSVGSSTVLIGDTPGQREQYQSGMLPAVVSGANQVLALQIEQRAANIGGSPHTFATEIDIGSGITEVAQNQLPGSSGYLYRPIYLDKRPDGNNWTAADIAALKAGFSIKS